MLSKVLSSPDTFKKKIGARVDFTKKKISKSRLFLE